MNFGAEFDDDVFEKPKDKNCKTSSDPIKQGAKICVPEWFLGENVVAEDEEDVLKCLKYKADFYYHSKNYQDACTAYERFFKMLPVTNQPARRECMENLARSHLHLDCPEKALEWALQMHAASTSADQKVVSWNLLARVCHRLKKFEAELEALHSCLEMHKSVPEFWMRLAYCYAGLFNIDLPGASISSQPLNGAFCCPFKARTVITEEHSTNDGENLPLPGLAEGETNDTSSTSRIEHSDIEQVGDATAQKCEMCVLSTQMISACLIRTRLLLGNSERSQLNQLRNARVNENITRCLNHLEIEQPFIEEASQMLRTEMFNNTVQTAKEDPLSSEMNSNVTTQGKENVEMVLAHSMQAMNL